MKSACRIDRTVDAPANERTRVRARSSCRKTHATLVSEFDAARVGVGPTHDVRTGRDNHHAGDECARGGRAVRSVLLTTSVVLRRNGRRPGGRRHSGQFSKRRAKGARAAETAAHRCRRRPPRARRHARLNRDAGTNARCRAPPRREAEREAQREIKPSADRIGSRSSRATRRRTRRSGVLRVRMRAAWASESAAARATAPRRCRSPSATATRLGRDPRADANELSFPVSPLDGSMADLRAPRSYRTRLICAVALPPSLDVTVTNICCGWMPAGSWTANKREA